MHPLLLSVFIICRSSCRGLRAGKEVRARGKVYFSPLSYTATNKMQPFIQHTKRLASGIIVTDYCCFAEVEYSRNIKLVIAALAVLFSVTEIDFKLLFFSLLPSSRLPLLCGWSILLLAYVWFAAVVDFALSIGSRSLLLLTLIQPHAVIKNVVQYEL